jgi:HSP20 family protein
MLLTTVPGRPVRTTSFDRRFDRTFAQLAGLAFGAGSFARPNSPAVSASWNDGTYVLTVDVPGVPEEALSVAVAGRTLTVDVATDNLTWNERIRLPQILDVEATTASYANGRLTVTVPAAPEAQPRKVEIIAGAPAAAEIAPADDQATDNPTNDTE